MKAKTQDPERRACFLAADALESAVRAGWDFEREDDPDGIDKAMRALIARLRKLGNSKSV